MHVRHEGDRVYQQRVAVGPRSRGELRSDIARGPAAVVDENRLPQALREARSHEARDHVDASTRRKGHDQPHRLGRVGFGLRRRKLRGGDRRCEEHGDENDFFHIG